MSIYGGFGYSGSACDAYLGLATGLPQTGNPPYTVTDFLSVYPKFAGPSVPVLLSLTATSDHALAAASDGLAQGQLIKGSGIAPGAVLLSVLEGTVNLTGDLTTGSPGVANVSSVAGLLVGMPVVGAGIPAGTTLAGVGTTTLLLSANATATQAGSALSVTATTLTLSAVATLTGQVTAQVYTQAPVAPAVIHLYLNLAYASLMSSRWREAWLLAMGWYIAHFLTLYVQSEGNGGSSPGQIAASGIAQGLLASKSADGLAMSFTNLSALDVWAAWGKTQYGQLLATQARSVGAGPIYVR